jgi:hypothetical protein
MSLTQKIGAHIRSAKAFNPDAHISDFQVRVSERGAVLINLRTGEAKLIEADKSDCDPLEQSLIQ